VSELSLNFNYGSTFLQWLVLAPGLINWVTQDTHLGLSRNYFGQDIDDNFIADNEWSSAYQCTPGATDPTDYTCPAGVAATPLTRRQRPDEQHRRYQRGGVGAVVGHHVEPGLQWCRRLRLLHRHRIERRV